jgi:hypothetical protein
MLISRWMESLNSSMVFISEHVPPAPGLFLQFIGHVAG